MSTTEQTIFTNMCMIYDGKGNVVVQDRISANWPGVTFPGGHVDPGESFTDAMVREVKEETGLSVSRLQMCGVKNWMREDGVRYAVLLYKTNHFEGTLTSSPEGEVFWTPLDRLSELKLAEGMMTMLRLFLEDDLTEQFFYKKDGQWISVVQ